jgi:hypothetical protein
MLLGVVYQVFAEYRVTVLLVSFFCDLDEFFRLSASCFLQHFGDSVLNLLTRVVKMNEYCLDSVRVQ